MAWKHAGTGCGRQRFGLAAMIVVAACAAGVAPASAVTKPPRAAALHPQLREELAKRPTGSISLFVRGTSVTRVREAGRRHGFEALGMWTTIDTVMLRGSRREIGRLRRERGIRFIEANRPLVPLLDTATQASRVASLPSYSDAIGRRITGIGVSAAIVDTGVDGTHPFLNSDGQSAVVRNIKVACLGVSLPSDLCYVDAGITNDTDTLSSGGHGTHVAGIVAGRPVTTLTGRVLRGAAPGASLVSISGGEVISMALSLSAQQWVLQHHSAPCGPSVDAKRCPPIRVVNHSWGPVGGGGFVEGAAEVQIQRELVQAGIVTVWAAGNDGGDGSDIVTNPPGQDPTGGILMVANYDDANSGTRDGNVSKSSSRGQQGEPASYPDVSAPGTAITSSCRAWLAICSASESGPGGADLLTFGTISGTSMATPHITGVVASLFQAEPLATPAQVERAIIESAYRYTDGMAYETDPRGGRTSPDKGHGLVDAPAALVRLREIRGSAAPVTATAPVPGTTPAASSTPAPDTGAPASQAPDSTPGRPADCADVAKAKRALATAKRALARARTQRARARAKRLIARRKAALRKASRGCSRMRWSRA